MSYEKTKKVNFGGVTFKKIRNMRSEKSTTDDVRVFCDSIENIESVLFVELTKYEKNSKNRITCGPKRQVRGTDIMFLLLEYKLHIFEAGMILWNTLG